VVFRGSMQFSRRPGHSTRQR